MGRPLDCLQPPATKFCKEHSFKYSMSALITVEHQNSSIINKALEYINGAYIFTWGRFTAFIGHQAILEPTIYKYDHLIYADCQNRKKSTDCSSTYI
jgi:hypothetical protein